MKHFFIEKTIVTFGIIGSLLFSIPVKNDTVKPSIKSNKSLVVVESTSTSTIEKINTDSIIVDAQRTIDAYNKSVIEKNKVNKTLLNLTKKEVKNAQITNKLIKQVTDKLKKDLKDKKLTSGETISDLKIDSVCSNYRKGFLGKRKCVTWDLTYYIYKGKEKIVLQSTKTN